MMNPRRLSTVPAPLLRSVILATGIVGLLAADGPAGIQNTGAASRKEISAPSVSTQPELTGAPQPGSMLNDDLGRTDVAIAELLGAVADASIARTSRSRLSKRPRPARRMYCQPNQRPCKSQWRIRRISNLATPARP